jgi:transcriptional regulator with XRE-family HTH domain
MAIGIVSDNDFDKEVTDIVRKDIRPSSSAVVDKLHKGGRKEGDNAIPDVVKELVINESLNGASGKELSQALGISQSSISAYRNGANSTATYDKKDKILIDHISRAKGKISKRARNVLNRSLDHLTDDKLSSVKAKDLAGIARNMSAIIRDMEPPQDQVQNQLAVQFVMLAPPVHTEKHYDAIDVSALDGD